MYLIFDTYEDALARSEQEGIIRGLSYHKNGVGTRYVTAPRETAEGNFALPVSSYALSDEEQELTVDDFTPVPQEEYEI